MTSSTSSIKIEKGVEISVTKFGEQNKLEEHIQDIIMTTLPTATASEGDAPEREKKEKVTDSADCPTELGDTKPTGEEELIKNCEADSLECINKDLVTGPDKVCH